MFISLYYLRFFLSLALFSDSLQCVCVSLHLFAAVCRVFSSTGRLGLELEWVTERSVFFTIALVVVFVVVVPCLLTLSTHHIHPLALLDVTLLPPLQIIFFSNLHLRFFFNLLYFFMNFFLFFFSTIT